VRYFMTALPAAALATGLALSAAGAATPVPPVQAVGAEPPRVTEHVLVISIDGLRPDAIERYEARTLQRLVETGAASLQARTVSPSKTLPSHTSMLSGVEPEVHGITWNTDRTAERGTVGVPTVFELAKRQGLSTAAFFSKSKLKHLAKPGTLDHVESPRHVDTRMATETVEAATRHMRRSRPNLLFVHIGEPDFAGHTVGWMSFAYGWAVRRADAGVARLLAAADATYGAGRYTVIVTADHGGHGRDHGTQSDEDTLIPWIAWGEGVEAGPVLRPVKTTDTAATVLWLLGIAAPADWTGRVVSSAFAQAAESGGGALPAAR
jgi:predicted AlkP superfamily pyrophosphatase or phosphodiesterase